MRPRPRPRPGAATTSAATAAASLAATAAATVALALALALFAAGTPWWPRPTPAAAPAPPPREPSRLVLRDNLDPTRPWVGTLARPVDPLTLADLPSFAPVAFGECGSPPLPDPTGRRLAIAVGWLGPAREGVPIACNSAMGRMALRLFDLDAWAWLDTLGLRADSLHPVGWSPDGSRLYAIGSSDAANRLGGLGTPEERQRLWVLDPSGTEPAMSWPLPYATAGVRVAPDGSALYALGYHLDPTQRAWIASGSPFLAVLDPASGAERARLALPHLRVGQHQRTAPDGRLEYPTYQPGLALAPDGSRLYLARPYEPVLDVVDLRDLRIERGLAVDRPRGALERLLDLLARPAAAKGGPSYTASLAISPDGTRLYTRLYPPQDAGASAPSPTPTFMVDTRTWEVRHFDATAGAVWADPRGAWVYARDAPTRAPDGTAHLDTARLRVLDAATGREVATPLRGRHAQQVVVHGDLLLLSGPTPDYRLTQPYHADDRLMEVIAIRVGEWREVARRGGHLNLGVATAPW